MAGDLMLSGVEERKELWLLFERHPSPSVRYVFNLARLWIRRGARFEWSDFHAATYGLAFDCPDIFRMSYQEEVRVYQPHLSTRLMASMAGNSGWTHCWMNAFPGRP
ncbi:hypothetical protein BJY01DRAFT_224154 [Aspergillus pseudoustus]|uniref:Uncharacterized protein n=1 Tax=Aspergillus pseudoustus TaxID=1810923 RepID=A0ABR4J4G5_9EURO